MKINIDNNKLYEFGLLFFLVLTTISMSTTTISSRGYVELVRYVAAGAVFLAVVCALIFGNVNKRQIIAVFLLSLLLLYGYFLAYLTGSIYLATENSVINLPILYAGTFILTGVSVRKISLDFVLLYVLYVFATLFATIYFGGLIIEGVPVFKYEYAGESVDDVVEYSQGVTKFYGFGAIALLCVMGKYGGLINKFVILLFSVAAFLALIGGGRGAILSVFFVLAFGFIRFNFYRFISVVLATIFGMYLISLVSSDFLSSFAVIERFSSMRTGELGMRDIYFFESVDLILSHIECLIFGCGFAFFQFKSGYEFGAYPHNVLVESLIVFGLPFVLFWLLFMLKSVFRYYKFSKELNFIWLLFMASVLIDLNGGYLLGNWFSFCFMIYLAVSYFDVIVD